MPHLPHVWLGQGTTKMPLKNRFLPQLGQLRLSMRALAKTRPTIAMPKAMVDAGEYKLFYTELVAEVAEAFYDFTPDQQERQTTAIYLRAVEPRELRMELNK